MIRNSIRRKLQAVFLIFVLFGVVSCGIFYFYMSRIREYQQTASQVDRLRIETLEARKFENNFLTFDARSNDFMASGTSRNLVQHEQTTTNIRKLLTDLGQNALLKNTGSSTELDNIRVAFEEYSKLFNTLTHLVKERGYRDYGLEGEMRKAIHELENGSSISKLTLLTLRRHEKDFFLRKDTAYVSQLENTAHAVTATEADKATLDRYLNDFARIVVLEKQIGLTEQTGDRGRMFVVMQEIDTKVTALNARITTTANNLVSESFWIITVAALVLLVLAGIAAFSFAYTLSKPIVMLDNVARSVVTDGIAGQEKELDSITSKDEIGSLAQDFKTMLVWLKSHIAEIDKQNEQLKLLTQSENKRSWRNSGLVKVEEVLRQTGTMSKFNELIFTLVRHLEAHQGALYVLEEGETEMPVMKLKAYFAGKNQDNATVRQGEGLIGEAWRKKEVLLLKDIQIPAQYAKMAAGLGYINPKSILVVPVIAEHHVEGVIEIASLYDIADHEVEFVKRAALQLALTLVLAKANDLNRRLVSTLQRHRVFPTPESIGGATHDEILEMLRRQEG